MRVIVIIPRKVLRVTPHYFYYCVCLKCPLQRERKRWTLTRLANSTLNNERPRAAHSLLMRHFSSSTYDVIMNTTSVKYVTGFQWFVVSVFFEPTHALKIWIRCCIRPNYDFCLSQGSV